jgi:large subunit ribosomal protein L10
MPTAEKIEKVTDLTERMSSARAIFLADFTGLDVASVTQLRSRLRRASVEYLVVKNRLAKRAVEAAGLPGLQGYLTGPTAIALVQEDPVESAKILQKFIKDGGKLAIKSGLVEGHVLSAAEVERLAALPSREVLLGQVVGTMQAPLSGVVGVLAAVLRGLVGVVAALEKKQREEGAAGAEATAA